METCINYCEPGWAYISSDERRWINSMRKLAAANPEDCIIMKQPEDNGGFIYAKFPQKWAKVKPTRKINMSEERKANLADSLRAWREAQSQGQDTQDEDDTDDTDD